MCGWTDGAEELGFFLSPSVPGSVAFSQDSVNSSGWGVARYLSPVCPPQLSAKVGVDVGLSGSRVYLVGTKPWV